MNEPDVALIFGGESHNSVRASRRTRAPLQHVDNFVSHIGKSLGTEHEGDAMLAVSAMIGALLLSRVQVDPKRSDTLLKAGAGACWRCSAPMRDRQVLKRVVVSLKDDTARQA